MDGADMESAPTAVVDVRVRSYTRTNKFVHATRPLFHFTFLILIFTLFFLIRRCALVNLALILLYFDQLGVVFLQATYDTEPWRYFMFRTGERKKGNF